MKMDIEAFKDTLANALLSTKWAVTDNEGKCEIEFTQTHILVREHLLPYTLEFDEVKNTLTIVVHNTDDSLLAILIYEPKKERWFGRSFKGGYIQIMAESNSHTWKSLGDPRKYAKTAKVQKPKGLSYIDEIPMDHTVPPYDILTDYPDFKDSIHPDACIALIACNRLQYFTQCVQALAQNPELKDLDVFLFLDKPTDTAQFEDSTRHIEVLKAEKPNAYIIQRSCNFGVGKNIIDCRRQLFDVLGFDYVFVIEDDVVVAPNYLSTMLNLWSWIIKNQYQNNIGIIQGWQYNVSNPPTSYVDINIDNLWAYGMSKACWEDIKEWVYQYEKDYLFSRYNERPHRTIFKWYESLPGNKVREGYPVSEEKLAILRGSLSSIPSTQEGCILTALYKKGWLRISPCMNLAENIGRSGVGKCEDYTDMGFENVKIQNLDIEEFEESL